MIAAARSESDELRRSPRFAVKADVLYRWYETEKGMQHGYGVTQDISRNGLFVLGNVCPPTGAIISVEVSMPPTTLGAKRMVLESGGTVVRTVSLPETNTFGFGAMVEHALFYQTPENDLEPVNNGY